MTYEDPVKTTLEDLGYREIRTLIELLEGYLNNTSILDDGVKFRFNCHSGCVFLFDEDYNTAMMNGDKIELWFNCPICGHEGFLEDIDHDEDDSECQEWIKDIEKNYSN